MNRESYNQIAPQWAAARSAFFGRERVYLDALLATAPVGATILDLGCGTGRPMAEHVVAQGYHVLGVDQSEALLDIARGNLPGQRWVLSTMQAFEPDQIVIGEFMNLPDGGRDKGRYAIVAEKA